MSAAALHIDGLTKSYNRKRVVDGVSMTVGRGEIVGFLGPNGAGKTSIMNMVMGLVKPDSGSVELLGARNGAQNRDIRLRVGYLQEKPCIYPDMTARAYLEHFALLYGVARPQRRVAEVLDRVGLQKAANRPLQGFSRGMQQRACLARVMLHEPDFMILDEPTLGLDPTGVADMREIFLEMRSRGATLLFSSHQLAEMERICDSIIFLAAGRLLASGRPEDLLPAYSSDRALAVEVAEDAAALVPKLAGVAGIESARVTGEHRLELFQSAAVANTDAFERRAGAARALSAMGATVMSVTTLVPTLEDLFLSLSGHKAHEPSQEGQHHGPRL